MSSEAKHGFTRRQLIGAGAGTGAALLAGGSLSRAICDGYHCSVMCPTNSSRLYLRSGTIDPERRERRSGRGQLRDAAVYVDDIPLGACARRVSHGLATARLASPRHSGRRTSDSRSSAVEVLRSGLPGATAYLSFQGPRRSLGSRDRSTSVHPRTGG